MKTINLFYVGNNYYYKSGTMLSSIYQADNKRRWDWGKVQIALKNGKEVNIRPATEEEEEWIEKRFEEVNKK